MSETTGGQILPANGSPPATLTSRPSSAQWIGLALVTASSALVLVIPSYVGYVVRPASRYRSPSRALLELGVVVFALAAWVGVALAKRHLKAVSSVPSLAVAIGAAVGLRTAWASMEPVSGFHDGSVAAVAC